MLLVHLFVLHVYVFVLFSSSWCRGLAAVCDCGIFWTFLLTFFHLFSHILIFVSDQSIGLIRKTPTLKPMHLDFEISHILFCVYVRVLRPS